MNNLVILGASGSIGQQTINVILNEKKWNLIGFSVGKNIEYAEHILNVFPNVQYVYIKDADNYKILRDKFPNTEIFCGDDGLTKLIEATNADIYVNALSGFDGVVPSINIITKNKILCLANKETIVCLGELYTRLLNENKEAKVIPIDSEHTGLLKCILTNNSKKKIKQYYITASGGPFFNYTKDELQKVTLKDALNHPNWKMGNKITIESASMINKAFEIIEACYLFNIGVQNLSVKIDRKSYVHAFLKMDDDTYLINFGPKVPTMKESISFALNYAINNVTFPLKDVTFARNLNEFNLFDLNEEEFPNIKYGSFVVNNKRNSGAIFNAIAEETINAFLEGIINFIDINKIIDKIMKGVRLDDVNSIDDIINSDMETRLKTLKIISERTFE